MLKVILDSIVGQESRHVRVLCGLRPKDPAILVRRLRARSDDRESVANLKKGRSVLSNQCDNERACKLSFGHPRFLSEETQIFSNVENHLGRHLAGELDDGEFSREQASQALNDEPTRLRRADLR
jgi:hypothetical protein